MHSVFSLTSAVDLLSSFPDLHHAFVIGGAQLYTSALENPATDRMLITHISAPDYECDTFFPRYQEDAAWNRAKFSELKEWAGEKLDDQQESDSQGEAKWEYQMWVR